MSLKDKCSNPLFSLVIFLIVFIIALLATVIILKVDSKPIVIQGSKEALVSPDESTRSTSGVTSSRPTVSTFENPKKTPNSSKVPSATTEKAETKTEPVISETTVRPNIPTLKPRNVCETPECITLAHQLLNWHDPSIDPCVDFYKSACGKYNEHTTVYGTRSQKKNLIVASLIDEYLIKNTTYKTKTENNFKFYYNKCVELQKNTEAFQSNSEQALKDIFDDIKTIGSWPLLDKNWDKSKFNLNDMLFKIASFGKMEFGLFEIAISDSLIISPVGERIEPDESLKKTIKEILKENGIKVSDKTLNKDFDEYASFIQTLDQYGFDANANATKFSHLEGKLPSIDFSKIIESWMNPKRTNGEVKDISEKIKNTTLVSHQKLFFAKRNNLESMIKKTPERTLANFLIFYFIELAYDDLSIDSDTVESRECAELAVGAFPEASLAAFVNNYFDKENLEIASGMVEESKENFIEMVRESTWLHEKTKEAAVNKLEKLKKIVGYPDQFKEQGLLDKTFENLNLLSSDSYYKIIRKVEKVRMELVIDFLGVDTEFNPLAIYLDANAQYLPHKNLLTLLVPFLDDPLFDSTYPKYVKIAVTGNTISHEMGHGFDTEGRTRDENGDVKDWWAKEDLVEYDKRVNCLVEQYNNYDDPDFGKNLDGKVTLDEMIADGLGVETAWRAFKKLDLAKEQKIVGFGEDYSIEKLYFRVAALDYCTVRSISNLEYQLTAPHPTDSFRVNGVFSNMKAFAETFNCPVGSPMNPKKKSLMSRKGKCSNPLLVLVIFLVIFIIAILTVVIVIRSKDRLTVPGSREALNVVTSTLKPPPATRNQNTSRPQIIITSKPRNVCETPECITLAHQLHNWQDKSVDPCVDFYKRACGKYQEHTITEGTRNNKKMVIVRNLIRDFLLNKTVSTSKSENAMKVLFEKCEMLKEQYVFEENGKSVLNELVEDLKSIGPWPLLEDKWDESKFDLNEMLINLAKSGKMQFGLFQIMTPLAPLLEIGPLYYREPPHDYFTKIISHILKANKIKRDKKVIAKDFEEYVKLGQRLDKHPYEMGRPEVKFSELKQQVPSVDFEKILENLINPARRNILKDKIKDRRVGYQHSLFFDKKDNLEHIIKSTPKRVMANFLIFNYLENTIHALSIDERAVKLRECDRVVIGFLPRASLRVFVRNYFDRENIPMVSELIENIKESFIEMIQESNWAHEKTKRAAILKVQKMKKMVGYPEEFEPPGALDKMLKTLHLEKSDSYYVMMKKIERFRTEQKMEYVALETELDPAEMILDVNANYNIERNLLKILIPFLDEPLFDSTFPKYVKTASTGFTLAHEIGHGFDIFGMERDENGRKRDWWTSEDSKEYKGRMKCLVDQYDEYDDPDFGRNLNGSQTIGEMMADRLGSATSWRAFKKLDLSNEPKIIGFENYDIEKLYFHIHALNFCAPRDTSPLVEAMEWIHPTDSFRVNGVFSNMKEFGEAFKCPIGSPMNPNRKCELF